MFAYMGADHDVEQVAMSISITNTIQFEKSEGGMQEMFERDRNAKRRYYEEMNERRDEFAQMSEDERRLNYAEMSNRYFQQESAAKPQFTPDRIESLSANEVFVFGSDIAGRHNGGAARLAVSRFGAKVGQAVGLQGSSYAIPTVGVDMNFIKLRVKEFIEFAKANSNLTFYVTRIGCGVAGFVDEDIAPFFKDALMLENVILPEMFYKIAKCYC